MLLMNVLTDSPYQTLIQKLENGQSMRFSLWYSYNQQGWFYAFTYGAYSVNNRRVVNSVNMIRSLRNVVPFGIACIMTDLYEPVFISDFKSGRAKIYTLNPNDVALVENSL